MGPALDRLDLLVHRLGERHGVRDDPVEIVLGEAPLLRVKASTTDGDHRLDLGPVEALRRLREEDDVEPRRRRRSASSGGP